MARRAWRGGHRVVPGLAIALLVAAMLASPLSAAAAATSSATAAVPPGPDVPADATPTIGTLEPGDVGVLTYDGAAAALIRVRDVVFHDQVPGLTSRISDGQFLEMTIDVHPLRTADPTVPGIFWNISNAYLLPDGTDWPVPPFPADQSFIATSDMSGKVGYEVYRYGPISMTWTGPDGAGFSFLLRPDDFRTPTGARTTGWPVSASLITDSVAFGPDGTVYMTRTGTYDEWFHQQELIALDAHGHMRAGWTVPVSMDWGAWPSIAVGADGTVYLASGNTIDAFGSDGRRLRGWPVVVPSIWLAPPPFEAPDNPLTILPVAAGGVDVVGWGPDGTDVLLSITRDAALRRGWPRVIPALEIEGTSAPFVAPGDRLVLTSTRYAEGGDVVEITAYGLDGKVLPGWPTRQWDDVALAPDGRLVAWRNSYGRVGDVRKETVTYAVLDDRGRPAGGWPRTIDGYGSRPGFGPDGAIEIIVNADSWHDGAESLVAFDRAGRIRGGYPTRLPSGMSAVPTWGSQGSPSVELAPLVVAADGTTYVYGYLARRAVVTAFGADGAPLRGWPYRLPAARAFAPANPLDSYSPAMPMVTGTDGRVYVATVSTVSKDLLGHGQVLAIGRNGTRLRGWPQALPDVGIPVALRPADAGGVTVASFGWLTLRLSVTRLDADGRVSR